MDILNFTTLIKKKTFFYDYKKKREFFGDG